MIVKLKPATNITIIANVDVQQSGLKRQKYSSLKIRYTQQF